MCPWSIVDFLNQREFPYQKLVESNKSRGKKDPEYELVDTGVSSEWLCLNYYFLMIQYIFEGNKYFDVFVEYAKADQEDILMKITGMIRLWYSFFDFLCWFCSCE
jgi:hypothetical protein